MTTASPPTGVRSERTSRRHGEGHGAVFGSPVGPLLGGATRACVKTGLVLALATAVASAAVSTASPTRASSSAPSSTKPNEEKARRGRRACRVGTCRCGGELSGGWRWTHRRRRWQHVGTGSYIRGRGQGEARQAERVSRPSWTATARAGSRRRSGLVGDGPQGRACLARNDGEMERNRRGVRVERWMERRVERMGLRPRDAADLLASFWALAVVVFGVLERIVDPKTFGSVWLGMWWAIQTVTTVGYGDVVPDQAVGKVIAAFLMLGGLSLLAVVTAAVTSGF